MIARRLLAHAPLQIVQALIGFATISAFTRLLSPESYGAYALLLSASMLAHTLMLTWAEAAAFRFFPSDARARDRADHFATLRAIICIAACAAIAGGVIAVSFGGYGLAIAFMIGAIFFRFLTRLARETDRAEQNIASYVGAELMYAAGGFALSLALLRFAQLGLAAPFAGMMGMGFLIALRDVPKLWRNARGGKADLQRLAIFAAYGVPLAAALALDLGVQTATRFILASTHGDAEIGAYAAAFGLARPLDLICAWIGLSTAPLLLDVYQKRGLIASREVARNASTSLALIATPAAIGLVLVAAPLVHVIMGAGVQDSAARALPWLAIAGLCNGVALHFFSQSFQLTKRTGLRALLLLAAAAFQLVATSVLTPSMGATGAAIAAAAGSVLALLLFAYFGAKSSPLAVAPGALARIGLATLTMAAVVIAIPEIGGLGELILKAMIGAIIYAAAVYFLNIHGARPRVSALLQPLSAKLASKKV